MQDWLWYIQRDGRAEGPFTSDDLRRLAREGELRPDDLVRRDGAEQWTPARQVRVPVAHPSAPMAGLDVGKPSPVRPAKRDSTDAKTRSGPQRRRLLRRLLAANVIAFAALLAAGLYATVTDTPSNPVNAEAVNAEAPPAASADDFDKRVQPLLKQYCYKCHNEQRKKAGLALDQYTDAASVLKGRKTWKTAHQMLALHEMPPEDQPQPTSEERLFLMEWIAGTVDRIDCTGPINPGRETIQRLNRTEYRNTIRDLLGIDYEPTGDFPADDVGYGYDNIGDVLSISPLLMEKYLAAADEITRRVFESRRQWQRKLERSQRRVMASSMDKKGGGVRDRGDNAVIFTSNAAVAFDHELPFDAQYTLRIRAWGDKGGDDWPHLVLSVDGQEAKTIVVASDDASTYEMTLDLKAGKHTFTAAFTNDYYEPQRDKHRDRNLHLHYIEIEQPEGVTTTFFAEDGKTDPYERLMIAQPGEPAEGDEVDAEGQAKDRPLSEEEAARVILRRFATRAFRRPVTDDELSRLLKLVALAKESGDDFDGGIQLAMQAVLVSPHFLFRIETDKAPADRANPIAGYLLNDWEIASRLSYFIYSSMPDEALLDAAAQGRLSKPAEIEKQVRRMLADPKSRALVDNFGGQWLQTRNLATAMPAPEHFPDFDENLRQAMQRETLALFEHILREDRPVTEFLTADYTFVNEQLARHYGLDGVTGEQFQKVALTHTPRRGVLTHASFLTITSDPNRTSPVKRGKWVLEQVLGTPPPPPPPDVPELEESDEQLVGTLRQRMVQHRDNPMCASCHERMDPIGFAFENFDGVGRWREKDNNAPIDAAGALFDGREFDGALGLVKLLADDKEPFVRNLAEQMLTYALGRGLEYYDQCAIEKITKDTARNNDRFSAMVTAIATSDPFRKRRAKTADE